MNLWISLQFLSLDGNSLTTKQLVMLGNSHIKIKVLVLLVIYYDTVL